jgi:hypothetical protein
MGGGQALLRFVDLLELVELVARLSGRATRSGNEMCNVDYAASVRPNTPHQTRQQVRQRRDT